MQKERPRGRYSNEILPSNHPQDEGKLQKKEDEDLA